jgi:hypothetical protein
MLLDVAMERFEMTVGEEWTDKRKAGRRRCCLGGRLLGREGHSFASEITMT